MHELGDVVIWHGRLMVLAWAFLFPTGVLLARFFKVLPTQDWPTEIDNKVWWYGHQSLQYGGTILVGFAVCLILSQSIESIHQYRLHRILGWTTVALLSLQIISGLLRGTKGGPTDLRPDGSMRGDHFDMTPRRRLFEAVHKNNGYLALLISVATILTGLSAADAPLWMTTLLTLWWLTLSLIFTHLQCTGRKIDTHKAIWGPTPPDQTFRDQTFRHSKNRE